MEQPAIRAEHLIRRFSSGKVAVNDVSLHVAKGEIYGFLGPNGAGKSTTVRMLVTLLEPTEGDAFILGHSVRDEATAVRLRIGVALQEAALDAQQTGIEVLRLQGRLYGLSNAQVEKRIEEMADLVDIGAALYQRTKSYSGGMKRRVDLAAALMHNPEVLFLDEPTTGLDPVSRARVWEEVRRLNEQQGMTIFLTTQYLEEADVLANRVGIIADGRLVAEGTPASLKKEIGNDLIFLEVNRVAKSLVESLEKIPGIQAVTVKDNQFTLAAGDGPAALSAVVSACGAQKLDIVSLSLRTPTLDDVFLKVTGNRMQQEEGL